MSHVIRKIRELERDEKKAPRDYDKLKKIVSLKGSKDLIRGIQRDERRHDKILKRIERREKKYDKD